VCRRAQADILSLTQIVRTVGEQAAKLLARFWEMLVSEYDVHSLNPNKFMMSSSMEQIEQIEWRVDAHLRLMDAVILNEICGKPRHKAKKESVRSMFESEGLPITAGSVGKVEKV
jgi:hypothetical protein